MLKFQEAANCASGSIAISTYPKTLIARRYVLQRKLGSGSFGTVYLVSDKKAKQGEELKSTSRLRNKFGKIFLFSQTILTGMKWVWFFLLSAY